MVTVIIDEVVVKVKTQNVRMNAFFGTLRHDFYPNFIFKPVNDPDLH